LYLFPSLSLLVVALVTAMVALPTVVLVTVDLVVAPASEATQLEETVLEVMLPPRGLEGSSAAAPLGSPSVEVLRRLLLLGMDTEALPMVGLDTEDRMEETASEATLSEETALEETPLPRAPSSPLSSVVSSAARGRRRTSVLRLETASEAPATVALGMAVLMEVLVLEEMALEETVSAVMPRARARARDLSFVEGSVASVVSTSLARRGETRLRQETDSEALAMVALDTAVLSEETASEATDLEETASVETPRRRARAACLEVSPLSVSVA